MNMASRMKRVNILGVQISPINMEDALSIIDDLITHPDQQYICVTPAHSIMDAYDDAEFRRILNSSGLTTPDGMSVVWILKLRGHKEVGRVYGPDIMLATCQRGVEKSYRHFLYGGKPGVADDLAAQLTDRFDGLQIAGTLSPPFRQLTTEEDRETVGLINAVNPDIVWVGLSSPKQERWMAEHLGRIHAPVMIGVGAAFDFLSGSKPQAPQWMQRSGLEWLFRFASEPRRLWPRYKRYPLFVWLVLLQILGVKKYPLE